MSTETEQAQRVYKVGAAARFCEDHRRPASVHTFRKWRKSGKGPAGIYDPSLRCWLYSEDALLAFIAEGEAARTREPQDQPAHLAEANARKRAARESAKSARL